MIRVPTILIDSMVPLKKCVQSCALTCNGLRFRSTFTPSKERIKQCYRILNIPLNSDQETVRKAFLELAKKYHPDSGHEAANIERFCEIEDAFRILTKKNTGSTAEADQAMEYDIRHKAPQHRQFLSFDGLGYGTPMQREKQYIQSRAQKAAENVMEHRINKAYADEKTLMKKENVKKQHDIKTQYGFERLAEDLIQEAMSKGDFDNLSGKGKPLKGNTNYNPYVDFTTNKINEVLINNGFTPEWITLNKDIKEEIEWLKETLHKEREILGPLPLTEEEELKWNRLCGVLEEHTKRINYKILSFNLIVPLLNKQMFLLKFDQIADDILKKGKFRMEPEPMPLKLHRNNHVVQKNYDILVDLVKALAYVCSFIYKVLKERAMKMKQ